jgi:hypothetical protein
MASFSDRSPLDSDAVEAIARRLTERVLARLESGAANRGDHGAADAHLTVGQVAERLGVARSTVYAHWREWGGFKLGNGVKAPIRFDVTTLPGTHNVDRTRDGRDRTVSVRPPVPALARRRKRRRDLLTDAPRFGNPIGSGS